MISFNLNYKNIDGVNIKDEPVAYCKSCRHKGYLSKANINEHKCDIKKCKYLVKNKKTVYWLLKDKDNLREKYENLLLQLYRDNSITFMKYQKLKKEMDDNKIANYIYIKEKQNELESKIVYNFAIEFYDVRKIICKIFNKAIHSIIKVISHLKGFKTEGRYDLFSRFYVFKPIGYCTYAQHPGYVSYSNNQCKQCLGKKCAYLVKEPKILRMSALEKKIYVELYVEKVEDLYRSLNINQHSYVKLISINNPYFARNFLGEKIRIKVKIKKYERKIETLLQFFKSLYITLNNRFIVIFNNINI